MKYDIVVVDGSDAATALEAINLTDAIEKAEAWLAKGDWGDEEDYLTLRIFATATRARHSPTSCLFFGWLSRKSPMSLITAMPTPHAFDPKWAPLAIGFQPSRVPDTGGAISPDANRASLGALY